MDIYGVKGGVFGTHFKCILFVTYHEQHSLSFHIFIWLFRFRHNLDQLFVVNY